MPNKFELLVKFNKLNLYKPIVKLTPIRANTNPIKNLMSIFSVFFIKELAKATKSGVVALYS
jgi:hypothetical protein